MPSRRHNSAMLSSLRSPSSTMRILSAAEKCRRVARRISFMTCSAGALTGTDFCLIFAPSKGYDDPEILPSSPRQICLIGADAGQLRIKLPDEIYIATSPFGSGRDAIPELLKQSNTRFDWVIRKRRYVSFFDPMDFGTRAIVDVDQVEAVDTALFALNDELDDGNDTINLLRRTLQLQVASQVSYLHKERLFYFHALAANKPRSYRYAASVKDASAKVVSYYPNKKYPERPGYVRHHAATFRFERLGDEWFVIIDPTFYFTRNGFMPHPFPAALLSGKKRLERNAAVRGQVIMWQNLLTKSATREDGLFDAVGQDDQLLSFE